MAIQTTAQLLSRSETVRTETLEGANTAERVGSLFRDINENKVHKEEPIVLPELTTVQRDALTGLSPGAIINHEGVLEMWDGVTWVALTPEVLFNSDHFEVISGVLNIKQVLVFNPDHFEVVGGLLSLKNP